MSRTHKEDELTRISACFYTQITSQASHDLLRTGRIRVKTYRVNLESDEVVVYI
jgi:hypothetical protein